MPPGACTRWQAARQQSLFMMEPAQRRDHITCFPGSARGLGRTPGPPDQKITASHGGHCGAKVSCSWSKLCLRDGHPSGNLQLWCNRGKPAKFCHAGPRLCMRKLDNVSPLLLSKVIPKLTETIRSKICPLGQSRGTSLSHSAPPAGEPIWHAPALLHVNT